MRVWVYRHICQEVCPWNQRFARVAAERDYIARVAGTSPAAHPGTDGPRLVELMAMDEAGWDAFSRGSAVRRAGYAGLERNVAVALGLRGQTVSTGCPRDGEPVASIQL